MRASEHSSPLTDNLPSHPPPSRPDAIGLALQTEDPLRYQRKSVQDTVNSADKYSAVNVSSSSSSFPTSSSPAPADKVRSGCTRALLPALIIFLVAGTIAIVLLTSGGAPAAEGVPRAALFIFEGFKGTAFDRLLADQRLPHIRKMLLEQRGVHAMCAALEDVRCARAVPVEDERRSGETYVSSGAGLANILTGVTPRRHHVRGDSWASYHTFAESAGRCPTVALRVTQSGRRVAALGASHLLHSLSAATGQCSEPGVLDAECGTVEQQQQQTKVHGKDEHRDARQSPGEGNAALDTPMTHCLNQRSCNLHKRILSLSSGGGDSDGAEERRFTTQLTELLGGLAATEESEEGAYGEGRTERSHSSSSNNMINSKNNNNNNNNNGNGSGVSRTSGAAASMDESLLIFHFNALARRAGDAALPNFTYEVDSLEYDAQAFLFDSLVGQVLALLRNRALTQMENWLVVGTSDHGGVGKAFGPFGDVDEVVPFFVATYTTNRRGHIRLRPLQRPVTHMDAAPTILRWLGIAPYDGPEPNSLAMNKTAPGGKTSESVWPLDGRPQGICSTGRHPVDCVVAK